MRQLTYVGGNTIEWWDVPAPKLLDDRDALVRPLAVISSGKTLSGATRFASGIGRRSAFGGEAGSD